jgi:outer membrane protein assembly factor BamB
MIFQSIEASAKQRFPIEPSWRYFGGDSTHSRTSPIFGPRTHNSSSISLRWTLETGARIWSSSPSIFGGSVFVGGADRTLHRINADTGESVWSFLTGGNVSSSPAIDSAGRNIFFASDDSFVYCLHAETGEERWRFGAGGAVTSSPVLGISETTLFVGSGDGRVLALDVSRWPQGA